MAISLAVSLAIAFSIPKRYTSVTRIMPPEQGGSGAALLAALTSRSGGLGELGSLAGGLLGGRTTTALFVDLLRSGTVSGQIVERFDLQHVYRKRYRVDTAKALARRTEITDDKKSGVITIAVQDTDPTRAHDMAQAYLDGLNRIVTRTSISTAHQERLFVEQRLHTVQADLERAQIKLSEFSSKNSTVDIKEQTRAMVDAGARVQGELLVEQAGLQSLRQMYGDDNVRVRSTQARIASLQHDLGTMIGSPQPASDNATDSGASSRQAGNKGELYPPLRQLPGLAVPYANLYREVRVQETVYELLTQQYELARIEEAKDVPVVSVIDPPGIPERKSFPPRLWISLGLTGLAVVVTAVLLIVREAWAKVDPTDPRKALALEIFSAARPARRDVPAAREEAA